MITIYFVILSVILLVAEFYYIQRARIHNWTSSSVTNTDGHPTAIIGGGFIFYLAIVVWSLGAGWIYDPSESMTGLMVGSTMLAACSFADDILHLKIWIRLVVQFIAVMFLYFQYPDTNYNIIIWIVYIIAAVGFINAYNFMDGINGITGLYSLSVLIPMLWYDLNVHHFISGTFIMTVIIAVTIFSIFNCRNRAIIFAGDVGSITMGYIITALISFMMASVGDITIVALIIVYAVDTIATILRRIIEKENIFQSHNKHVYQILNRVWGYRQISISICYAVIQTLITIGYFYIPKTLHWTYLIGIATALSAAWLIITLLSIKKINKNLII